MKSITKQKPFEEIEAQLADYDRVFIVGCGTCTTMTKTGGIDQVAEMQDRLQEMGKRVRRISTAGARRFHGTPASVLHRSQTHPLTEMVLFAKH